MIMIFFSQRYYIISSVLHKVKLEYVPSGNEKSNIFQIIIRMKLSYKQIV